MHSRNVAPVTLAALLTCSCGPQAVLSPDTSIDGCYKVGPITLTLSGESAKVDGLEIAKFHRGVNQAGSFIKFKPGLHIMQKKQSTSLELDNEFPTSYISIIEESGRPTILFPTTPIGLFHAERMNCKAS